MTPELNDLLQATGDLIATFNRQDLQSGKSPGCLYAVAHVLEATYAEIAVQAERHPEIAELADALNFLEPYRATARARVEALAATIH